MDEDKNIITPISAVPDTNLVVDSPPQEPTSKIKIIPLIVLGLLISMIVIGLVLLAWKIIQNNKQPDLLINAPTSQPTNSQATSNGETIKFDTPKIDFEDKPYTNTLAKFQISVPKGWQIDESGESGAIVVLIDPKVTVASNSALLTIINVSTGKASGETLESYITQAKKGLQKTFNSYVIDEDRSFLSNGNTYYLIGGSYISKGLIMKNRNILLVYDNRGYAISATAPESVWKEKEFLLNATVDSFKNI